MRIERLSAVHRVQEFDCGNDALNTFLHRFAWSNESAGGCRTYVAHDDGRVAGFYSLVAGSIRREDSPARIRAGMARHPIPVLILARLAVDRSWQGQGVGRQLLRNAFRHAERAAEIIGIRALLVHAKDDEARAWYARQAEFEAGSPDPFQLLVLMKDIRRMQL